MIGILDTFSIPRAAFVAHSFGTFFLSRLNRLAPGRIAAMAMVDPVCMCMWSGHLVRSFVYSPHKNKSGGITWFISRDIHTAAAVARDFWWGEYNMWPDMVGVALAGGFWGAGGSGPACGFMGFQSGCAPPPRGASLSARVRPGAPPSARASPKPPFHPQTPPPPDAGALPGRGVRRG
jgi:pimeloyl-ACP methyl ester carboxylesterase